MNKRPKNLSKEYGWCSKPNHGVIFSHVTLNPKKKCFKCETEAERRKKGLCCAILGHGPGHQSKTYCQEKGDHKIHRCTYGSYDQVAEWKGSVTKIKFTGYFDDPPSL